MTHSVTADCMTYHNKIIAIDWTNYYQVNTPTPPTLSRLYVRQLLVVSYDGLCMTVVAHDNISLKQSRIGLGLGLGLNH